MPWAWLRAVLSALQIRLENARAFHGVLQCRPQPTTGRKAFWLVCLTSTPASPIFCPLCPNLLADWAAMIAAAIAHFLLAVNTSEVPGTFT
jgi:hypothetical protein